MSHARSNITPAQQTWYALGEFAGLSSSQTGHDLDHATFKAISTALEKAAGTIGAWNIVWGPSVVAQPFGSGVAMNTMYVARSQVSPSQYVIAIAGTNPGSILDWVIEDGLVSWQVPWIYAPLAAPHARISLGTAIGTAILQTMKPSASVPGSGSTLVDFLATITREPVQIAVTGHSLGGALAPTVALWLADTQGFLSHWDPHKRAALSALPTAGPTAGNQPFATYSGKKLGASLTPYFNKLDVVPHAWHRAMLEEIPYLYLPEIPALRIIKDLVKVAVELSKDGDYTTLPGLVSLAGTFHQVPGNNDLERFLYEVAYQHTVAYYPWFNFNADWLPKDSHKRLAPSPAVIDALSVKSGSPGDLARALTAHGPRTVTIDGTLVDLPTGASDPRGAHAVAQVTAELQKHAAGR
jgi:hypothetical protein